MADIIIGGVVSFDQRHNEKIILKTTVVAKLILFSNLMKSRINKVRNTDNIVVSMSGVRDPLITAGLVININEDNNTNFHWSLGPLKKILAK
jgi:propanediol utilization protein